MLFDLELLEPNSKPKRVSVVGDSILVGRNPSCDIRLSSTSVSREHAKIEIDESRGLVLTDLNSRNGVFVNGERISGPVSLDQDVEIRIGPVRLKILRVAEERLQTDPSRAHLLDAPVQSDDPPSISSDTKEDLVEGLSADGHQRIGTLSRGELGRKTSTPTTSPKRFNTEPWIGNCGCERDIANSISSDPAGLNLRSEHEQQA